MEVKFGAGSPEGRRPRPGTEKYEKMPHRKNGDGGSECQNFNCLFVMQWKATEIAVFFIFLKFCLKFLLLFNIIDGVEKKTY
jgi:hypothetical protein